MFEIEQAVVGGFVGDVRKDAIRAFGYRAVFAYAVAVVQCLHSISHTTESSG